MAGEVSSRRRVVVPLGRAQGRWRLAPIRVYPAVGWRGRFRPPQSENLLTFANARQETGGDAR
jgi:hypothetical protein